MRRLLNIESVLFVILVLYPLAFYACIYIPWIVPRLAQWRTVPLSIKIAVAVPYGLVLLANGWWGTRRSIVLKGIAAGAALIAWQEIGYALNWPALGAPDLASIKVVVLRAVAMGLAYCLAMLLGRLARVSVGGLRSAHQ